MLQTAAGHILHGRQPIAEGPACVVLVEGSPVVGLKSSRWLEDLSGDPSHCRRAVGGLLCSTALLCCPFLFAGWPSSSQQRRGCWLWDTSMALALRFSDGSYLLPPNCGSSPQCWEPGCAWSPGRNLAAVRLHVPSLLSYPIPMGEHSRRTGSAGASMKHICMCDGCEATVLLTRLPWHVKVTVQTMLCSAVLTSAVLHHASRKKIQK